MKKKILGIIAVSLLSVASLAGCNLGGKANTVNKDAPSSNGYGENSPAEVHQMPDGYSNFADKCDGHGHRVYVLFHNNSPYGGITAINDPTCPGGVTQ